ncbi:ABC transporter substrate-binding protein [Bosea sp. (in: a-proteobacteria)]|uniref:ABC transporter substrate-binding protein n=1 Tax=Bosea sp. (in: a-proteobacteria) TaxID=1871050 RepID=UPI0026110905|nr:ABC transporter substrate-binding protein [Bosea sp. (in: a-proteobacteria)]MCO5091660.1 ABC transporter substrate-binding protein [Bosea sp. (in: a-proteobacteria)]
MKFAMTALVAASVAMGSAMLAPHAMAADPVRIGVLGDQSSNFADSGGPGSVLATQMAVEDFGGSVLGRPIEVLVADHQNKVDTGIGIAREWYETKGVSVISDFASSAIALGVQDIARKLDKIAIYTTASSSDLIGKACSPNGQQWGAENWSNSAPLMTALASEPGSTFFFITVDYTFGHQLEDVSRKAIEASGGKVLGRVTFPLNTLDMSSYLLAAKASGAKVIVLALSGADLVTAMKQASEFGIMAKQKIAAPILFLTEINTVGLKTLGGLQFLQSWYWDQDDASRSWAKRYFERMKKMPNESHATLYAGMTHYLDAVKAAGTLETQAVLKKMRETPVNGLVSKGGRIMENGRVSFDRFLVQIKTPEESKFPWDFLKIVSRIPAEKAFRTPAEAGCTLQ